MTTGLSPLPLTLWSPSESHESEWRIKICGPYTILVGWVNFQVWRTGHWSHRSLSLVVPQSAFSNNIIVKSCYLFQCHIQLSYTLDYIRFDIVSVFTWFLNYYVLLWVLLYYYVIWILSPSFHLRDLGEFIRKYIRISIEKSFTFVARGFHAIIFFSVCLSVCASKGHPQGGGQ